MGYFVLTWFGIIPRSWHAVAVPIFIVAGLIAMIATLPAMSSAWRDGQHSNHPDPEVRALIDGEINITEYRLRKKSKEVTNGG